MDALLQGCLSKALDGSGGRVRVPYLIIRDCVNYVFNESAQDIGVINVPEELHKPMLLGKWSKVCNNSGQLPAKNHAIRIITAFLEEGSTNFLRTSLRTFSSLSWSPTGYASTPQNDRILSSISLI